MHVNVPVVLVVLYALYMYLGLMWRFAFFVVFYNYIGCFVYLPAYFCVSLVFVGDA